MIWFLFFLVFLLGVLVGAVVCAALSISAINEARNGDL